MYRPQANFNVAMKLLKPEYKDTNGVPIKKYKKPDETDDEYIFFGDFKTYGGTEKTVDGIFTIVNTATVNTWFWPDITSDCRVCVLSTGKIYDIINDPENIEMRNQFMQLKLSAVGGKP